MAVERASSVLLTADTVGGVWTYAVELARALAAAGVQVHLATMGGPIKKFQREQLEGIAPLSVHESEYRLEWMDDPWDDVRAAGEWLLRLEAELAPDIVHLNQFAFGALPFRAPKLLVAHSCVLSWWRAVRGETAPSEWDGYHRAVARGLAGAHLVAAPTLAMLSTLADNYGFRGSQVVLPNARDAALFQPGPKRNCIFAAGRLWDEAKNLVALDAVAEQLPWPVAVAGSCIAPHGGMIQPRWAHPLGEVGAREVAREMATAAIYALPARYEPFGLSILEAALCGCALVLGDIASLRETWGANALYVPPDDHGALRATLMRLILDTATRERLGRAARRRALHFQPQRMAQGYIRAYTRLLQEETVCA
jgi:glycogen(starch) synthase